MHRLCRKRNGVWLLDIFHKGGAHPADRMSRDENDECRVSLIDRLSSEELRRRGGGSG